MMKIVRASLLAVLCVAVLAGCTKSVHVTVRNHSASAKSLQLTVPDGTMPIGTVSPNGRLSYLMKLRNEDLPAMCNLAAGGSSQSFTVTEDTPDAWWFDISQDGRVAGPYGERDVHVETVETESIQLKYDAGTVVK